jgi:serine protease Do
VVLEADTGEARAIEWSDQSLEVGDVVVAMSFGGLGQRTTVGTLSATGRTFRGPRGRKIADAVEHTAPLARGSSGGPLLDRTGHVIGINTHRLDAGFYLARPTTAALRSAVDDLVSGRSRDTRRLGVALAPVEAARRLRAAVGLPERDGLLVRGVVEGSPAATAGILAGDLLVAADGRTLDGPDDLYEVLGASGDEISVSLVRGVEDLKIVVRFAPPAESTPS